MTYEELDAALHKFFSDTERPASETKQDLQAFVEEAEMLIDSLDSTELE